MGFGKDDLGINNDGEWPDDIMKDGGRWPDIHRLGPLPLPPVEERAAWMCEFCGYLIDGRQHPNYPDPCLECGCPLWDCLPPLKRD
jgi:hypothetical protein